MNDTFFTDPLPPIPTLHSPWAQHQGPLASTQLSLPFSPTLPITLGTKLKPTIEPLHYICRYVSPLGRASHGKALHDFLWKTKQEPWHFKPALPHRAAYPTHPEKERQYLRFIVLHPSHSTVSGCYWAGLLAGCLSCPASITFPTSLSSWGPIRFPCEQGEEGSFMTVSFWGPLHLLPAVQTDSFRGEKAFHFSCLLVCPDKR